MCVCWVFVLAVVMQTLKLQGEHLKRKSPEIAFLCHVPPLVLLPHVALCVTAFQLGTTMCMFVLGYEEERKIVLECVCVCVCLCVCVLCPQAFKWCVTLSMCVCVCVY